MNGSDVLIVGGGLMGLSSAFQLVRRGYRVRLLEAEYCGRHASGVNAGGVRTQGRDMAEIPLALVAREQLWHHLQELLGDGCGFVPSGQLQVAENEADERAARERVALLQAHGFRHEVWVDAQQVLIHFQSWAILGGVHVET